ncbi:MAG: alpha/beta fold hydrolase [Oligosphaeraceae bacterium]|mgnify:FL=1|nr:alpha/beta fold hydrolase [Oligosphaeraceae bacterium]
MSIENRITFDQAFSEEPFTFSCGTLQLRGILSLPLKQEMRGALVCSHGWSGTRSGPVGLLTDLARSLASKGYAVLRFDYAGRGESDGAGLQSSLLTMADNLEAASKAIKKHLNCNELHYLGLCSGANVVIGALKRLPEAKSLLLLSVYPFSDGDSFSRDLNRLAYLLRVYWQKALRKETWKRLFAGDVRLTQVFRVLFAPLLKGKSNQKKEGAATTGSDNTKPDFSARSSKATKSESRLQQKAAPQSHLKNLRADLPVLMLYGTADPDAKSAAKYFGEYAEQEQLPLQIDYLEGADHNFTSQKFRQELKERVQEFFR